MTRGQIIRAHRARKNMTELQCAARAGVPKEVWLGVERDEQQPDAAFAAHLDKFTDGDVSVDSWSNK